MSNKYNTKLGENKYNTNLWQEIGVGNDAISSERSIAYLKNWVETPIHDPHIS
jgi:hypothetical protein